MGVADPDFATLDQRVTQAEEEWEAAARARFGETYPATKLALQRGGEGSVIHRHHGIGLGGRQCENDGVFLAKREQGERAIRREAFPGAILVPWLRDDFSDHCVLMVVADLDGRVVARCAFGVDQQRCLDAA